MKKRIINIGIYVICSLGIMSCAPSSTPSDDIEKIDFGNLTDTIKYFKQMEYGKSSIDLYEYLYGYLKNENKNLEITDKEFEIKITGIRNEFGKKLNIVAEELLANKKCCKKRILRKQVYAKIKEWGKFEKLNSQIKKDLEKYKKNIGVHNMALYYAYSTEKESEYPYSVTAKYDENYSEKRLKEAKLWIRKYPYGCSSVKNIVVRVKSNLNRRHQDFIEKLVDLLVSEATYDYDKYSQVMGEIDKYFYKGSSKEWAVKYGVSTIAAKDFVEGLIHRMEIFKEEKLKIEQNENTSNETI